MPISIDPNGSAIRAKLEILNAQIGVYAIDLWNDDDRSGGPSAGDTFLRRVKDYSVKAAEADVGAAKELDGKTLQFIWLVRKDPSDPSDCRVSVDLTQGGKSLDGFPKTLTSPFREGKHHDIFQVWYYLHG